MQVTLSQFIILYLLLLKN